MNGDQGIISELPFIVDLSVRFVRGQKHFMHRGFLNIGVAIICRLVSEVCAWTKTFHDWFNG